MEARFDIGILREEIPGPGEGVGDRLVAGKEDGEDFVADLLVGHALGSSGGGLGVGLVSAGDEHGEQVAAVGLAAIGGHFFAVLGG